MRGQAHLRQLGIGIGVERVDSGHGRILVFSPPSTKG
jgi:hypothetical protein